MAELDNSPSPGRFRPVAISTCRQRLRTTASSPGYCRGRRGRQGPISTWWRPLVRWNHY